MTDDHTVQVTARKKYLLAGYVVMVMAAMVYRRVIIIVMIIVESHRSAVGSQPTIFPGCNTGIPLCAGDIKA